MIRVAVLYPKTEDSHFDWDYYMNKHMTLVRERLTSMGLTGDSVDEGLGGATPKQPVPFAAVCYLHFDTMEAMQQGLGTHGKEIMGDIPNFTNVQPQVLVSRVRE